MGDLQMSSWKRIVLATMGLGAGFAIALSIVIIIIFWHQAQPKPWNKKAIVASYANVNTEGKDNTLVFHYTIENTMDSDWKIAEHSDIIVMAKLKDSKSLSGSTVDKFITITKPIFLPTKQRLFFTIHLKYPYDKKLKNQASRNERKKYRKELEAYITTKLSNLDGFVVYDETNRYQIDFPGEWSLVNNKDND